MLKFWNEKSVVVVLLLKVLCIPTQSSNEKWSLQKLLFNIYFFKIDYMIQGVFKWQKNYFSFFDQI